MATYQHSRPKGWITDWRPQSKTLQLLEHVDEVLATYQEHLPLTARQIFYRLVAIHGYEKTENGYERLCGVIVRARRARRIKFDAIRDDGWIAERPMVWESPAGLIKTFRAAAKAYERDKEARQPRRLAVIVEAAGMVPQAARVAGEFSVPVFSSSGFDSLTVKKQLADLVDEDKRPMVFLHVGDLDPSGVCIFDALRADVEAFVADRESVEFVRLALTPEQVERFRLPTAPPKATDRRGNNVTETCQAEALPPNVLAELIRAAIEQRMDPDILAQDYRDEKYEREEIVKKIEGMMA